MACLALTGILTPPGVRRHGVRVWQETTFSLRELGLNGKDPREVSGCHSIRPALRWARACRGGTIDG